jgi:hypothetical protein
LRKKGSERAVEVVHWTDRSHHGNIEIRRTENTGKNWNGIQAGCQNDCQNEIKKLALSH